MRGLSSTSFLLCLFRRPRRKRSASSLTLQREASTSGSTGLTVCEAQESPRPVLRSIICNSAQIRGSELPLVSETCVSTIAYISQDELHIITQSAKNIVIITGSGLSASAGLSTFTQPGELQLFRLSWHSLGPRVSRGVGSSYKSSLNRNSRGALRAGAEAL